MGQKDDHIEEGAEDPSRILASGKPLYELGSTIGAYELLSVLGEGGFGIIRDDEAQHAIRPHAMTLAGQRQRWAAEPR